MARTAEQKRAADAACKRRYHENNREKERIRMAEYRAANREKTNAAVYKINDRNRAIIRAAKEQPCVDCEAQYHYAAMDLDHVRGTKVMGVSKMLNASVEALEAEIAKCDVRCAVCHRLRHAGVGDNAATSISLTQ